MVFIARLKRITHTARRERLVPNLHMNIRIENKLPDGGFRINFVHVPDISRKPLPYITNIRIDKSGVQQESNNRRPHDCSWSLGRRRNRNGIRVWLSVPMYKPCTG